MSICEIVILSVALALDALIVSFSYGLIINANRTRNALLLGSAFGFFQFLMPVLGWFFTGSVYSYLERFSKWIVFAVFFALGCKFLKEAFEKKEEVKICCIGLMCVLGLAIATSIDAFGAGVSIRLLNVNIFIPALMIGAITFILSVLGFAIANSLKKFPAKYIEIGGGLLLFYLAIKALF
ncbi:MAG: manganese efflux pump [Candidatus Gastranaerophilales bacterium]|nr:manganese efflux pump [Candidatus Gastranaerophilales bacterium]